MIARQLALAIDVIFWVWYFALLARVILSWVRLSPWHPISRRVAPFIYAITEPLLRPIRKVLAKYQAGSALDFSPFIAYLLLQVVHTIILRVLFAV